MKNVDLNRSEQALCKYLARKRYETAREAGVKNSRMGSQSDENTDLEGIAAELAFAKLYSVYPSGVFDLGARSSKRGEDSSGDVTVNDLKIDVKATQYTTGRLIVAPWKDHSTIDYYALVVGKFPHYDVKGLMSSSEIMRPERLKKLPNGNHEVYQAEQNELVFPKELT